MVNVVLGTFDIIKDVDGELLQDNGTEWATGNQREIPKKLRVVGIVWEVVE